MPELAELKIMSDYINQNVKDKNFKKVYHVEKGNISVDSNYIEQFKVEAISNGKELVIRMFNDNEDLKLSVFMGMSGNWLFTPTETWSDRKFTRLRLDTDDGMSLLLYGLYMGPKYRLGGFTGVKRGVDPTTEFETFKKNILDNLDKKVFDKPICEALLDQKYFNGIGAYLCSEIIGRLDVNPFRKLKDLNNIELSNLFDMILSCCNESYKFGGGELLDWKNPFGSSKIDEWIMFYNNKESCYKEKFGTRNIWIHKKWKEHMECIKNSLIGVPKSTEHRDKISKSLTGIKRSDEFKNKLSESLKNSEKLKEVTQSIEFRNKHRYNTTKRHGELITYYFEYNGNIIIHKGGLKNMVDKYEISFYNLKRLRYGIITEYKGWKFISIDNKSFTKNNQL